MLLQLILQLERPLPQVPPIPEQPQLLLPLLELLRQVLQPILQLPVQEFILLIPVPHLLLLEPPRQGPIAHLKPMRQPHQLEYHHLLIALLLQICGLNFHLMRSKPNSMINFEGFMIFSIC